MTHSDITSHIVHTESCSAYKVIGRFGSRSGLRWAKDDQRKCDCGARELLILMRSAMNHAENSQFRNNDFEDAERWEKYGHVLKELLGEA